MITPTSPGLPPNADSGNLAPTIDAIVGGDFSRTRLAAFSDLDRGRAAILRARWLDIPDSGRNALVLALAELGAESLDFNFNRVFRIALEDPNPVVRQLAIEDLWEDEGSDLPPKLVQMLQDDPSDDVRAAAAAALSAACDVIADDAARMQERELLLRIFYDLIQNPAEPPLVRRRSLGTIAAFSADSRVNELILLGLDDEDQTVVAGAIHAMGRTASAKWIPELLEFMQSEDAELRFEAARAAGLLADPDAVPHLSDLVYDQDAEVRAAAVDSLGIIGGPAAIRVLRQIEQDEDFEDTEYVEEALEAALLTEAPLDRLVE